MISWLEKFFIQNGLIVAFLTVAVIMLISSFISRRITKKKIPDSAVAIFIGLLLAYIGGRIGKGTKGIADVSIFSGFGLMGGAMFRDFAVVSTAMGASFDEIRKSGLIGVLSLFIGVAGTFTVGAVLAVAFGYTDAKSITTIAAGACTFIVGPITGAAIGAESHIIAISIAAGVVKSILVTIATPAMAGTIGLNNPQAAMAYGGLMGTTSGVTAGLAATDPKLVPYGAMTATFYTGLGCLLCPSVLYYLVTLVMA
jgi:malonate transporter MadM subunit